MKKIILAILLISTAAFAQQKFNIKGAPGYDVRLEVAGCDKDYCGGAMTVELLRKGPQTVIQKFKLSTDFRFYDGEFGPGRTEVDYQAQGVVNFEDYNFDGIADLSIQNGMDGGYSGGSYNIYIYSQKLKKFVSRDDFSALATSPFMGMFEVNKKRRVLQTSQKSGCCMHEGQEYRVINDRPVMVFSVYEDASSSDKWVVTTTSRLIKGKWHRIKKRSLKKTDR